MHLTLSKTDFWAVRPSGGEDEITEELGGGMICLGLRRKKVKEVVRLDGLRDNGMGLLLILRDSLGVIVLV